MARLRLGDWLDKEIGLKYSYRMGWHFYDEERGQDFRIPLDPDMEQRRWILKVEVVG